MESNVIPFPPDRVVRPARQTSSDSSPWLVVGLVIGGLVVWEFISYSMRPIHRRNPRRRHRRAA
jgi:hypothetical protein